jgi:hypothetical protein
MVWPAFIKENTLNRIRNVLFVALAVTSLAGCSSQNVPSVKNSASTKSEVKSEISAYEIDWSFDQALAFPSEQRLVGVVKSIKIGTRDMGKGFIYEYLDYTIEIEDAEPMVRSNRFKARVINFQEVHVEQNIGAGDRVLYLGSFQKADDFGMNRGVTNWLLPIDSKGLVFLDETDTPQEYNSIATKLGLDPLVF